MANPDVERFQEILKGTVREDLAERVQRGQFSVGPDGRVSVPVDYINIPRLRRGFDPIPEDEGGDGENDPQGGVGQGSGNIGDIIDQGKGEEDEGLQPGEGVGQHATALWSLDEFLDMLGEEFQLPNLEPKGDKQLLPAKTIRWNSERKHGPLSLLRYEKSFANAIMREQQQGVYDPDVGVQTLIPGQDLRFLSHRYKIKEENAAVLVYILDLSGSMYGEPREIAREQGMIVEGWLQKTYKSIEKAYIVHDSTAWEARREDFFGLDPSGGTYMHPAMELTDSIVRERYPPESWNIYVMQFTDGFTFANDNQQSGKILRKNLLPDINMYFLSTINQGYRIPEDQLNENHFHVYIRDQIKPLFPDKVRVAYTTDGAGSLPAVIKLLGASSHE